MKRNESWEAFEETGSDGNKIGVSFYRPKNFEQKMLNVK